jgi:hypothetical protein
MPGHGSKPARDIPVTSKTIGEPSFRPTGFCFIFDFRSSISKKYLEVWLMWTRGLVRWI